MEGRRPEGTPVRCLLIWQGKGEWVERLEGVCRKGVHLVGVASDLEGARQVLGQERPQVVLLGLDGAPREILRIAEGLPQRQVTFLGVGDGHHMKDADLLLSAMRAGVREFIPLDPQALAEAAERWAPEQGQEPLVRRRTGKVVAIFGAAGGCGVTTMVVNLGALLTQEFGRKTALVDLNLQDGCLGLSLDMGPGPTLSEAASAALSEDWQTLSSLAYHHRSGVHVFPEPEDLVEADRVTPDEVGGLLRGLTGLYDFVIVDCPSAVNPHTLRILDEAHRVFLVTTPTIPALRNAVRRLDVFQQLGVAKEKIDLFVSEVSPILEISAGQRQEVLGWEVRGTLPHDPKAVVGALNRGQPVLERAPKSPYVRSLREIASFLAERRGGQAAGQPEDPHEAPVKEERAK